MDDVRLLIDGKLVEAEGGATFDNVNPATEEVIGQMANGSAADMARAIQAARTAFDTTDWSTNGELRKRCLLQLQAAIEAEADPLRNLLVSEVGCAVTLKRVFLELGGKSVNLFLEDADFASSLPFVVTGCVHGGQGCAISTRIMVPRSRYDEAIDMIAAGFAGWSYGDPTDPSMLQGPQISKRQQDRVLAYIEKGKAEGARVVTGGGVPGHLPKGFYVEPTLFADVDNSMTIAREEIFGPVLVVIPFDDDDDAVRIANQSTYGLSGMITSGDTDRALALARRIRTGTIGVNGGIWYGADAPFGGYKRSGIGRQCGTTGLEIFIEIKTV